jgi:ABC-2 type transport system ATP-binding protein
MNDFAIRTYELSRRFGDVQALSNLSLDIPRGIVFGFLGPNGSGKTTTIRLLLGLLRPTSGRAEVLGYDTVSAGNEIRLRTGALLEHSGLYERLSAWENLDFYARIARLSRRERSRRIEQILTHLGLWERRGEIVNDWSRGMKQKLAVARALLHRPPLIFLDEPTAGLDPLAAAALRNDLAELAEEGGVTVFLTTHNLSEAEKLCALVGVIHKGDLLAIGPPSDLHTHRGSRTVLVRGDGFSSQVTDRLSTLPGIVEANLISQNGTPFVKQELRLQLQRETRVSELVNYLVAAGVQVEEVRQGNESLEDVFLALVNNSANADNNADSNRDTEETAR